MSDPFALDDDLPDPFRPAPRAAAGPVEVPADAPWLVGLNPEQHQAVTTTEGPVLVLSGAGTGKTRVLTARLAQLLAARRAQPWQILAVTFTNRAAREMRERVAALVGDVAEGLWLGTFHALCVRILRRHPEAVGLKSNFTILDSDDQLRLLKQVMEAEHVDTKTWPAQALMATIQRWKDRGLTPDKLGPEQASDMAGGRASELYGLYQQRLAALNACDFGDLLLHCLTLFLTQAAVLEQYQSQFRYVLVDEYQDTNVAQYLWLRLLAGRHKNICCVGDDDQCLAGGAAITMADGSTKPIEAVVAGDQVLSSFGSGNFRAASVVRTHRSRKRGTMVRVRTLSGRELVSTAEHNHFADVVLDDSPQTYFTYLMIKQGYGYRLGTSQVYTSGKRRVIGYQQRCLHERADAVWLIHAFATEQDARELEHRLSLRFGITTMPFVARRGGSVNGLVHDQARLDRLHGDLRETARVADLMREYGLDPDHPHHVPQSAPGRRRNLILTLNADRRGRTPMHRIALSGNDAEGAAALDALGLGTRRYKRNPANWRYETAFRDYGMLETLRLRLSIRFDLTVVRKANVLGKALTMRPACQVVPGMVVPLADGAHDVVMAVERFEAVVPVFDLDVAGTHNYVANGVVTHNSIYSWRGAEVGNILKFERDFPGAKVVRLESNYRSTPHILAAASHLIDHNAGRLGKTLRPGLDHHPDAVEKVRVRGVWDGPEEARVVVDEIEALQRAGESLATMAILVRAGFQTREFEERLITTGVPYRVIGGPRFYERQEIRDAMAYFRLVVSPDNDLAFERIVNLPKRGLGDAALLSVRAVARGRGLPLFEAARLLVETDELKPKPRAALARFCDDVMRWRGQLDGLGHVELGELIIDESGYGAMWQADKSPDAPGRLENLKELVRALAGFGSMPGFLEHVALVMENDERADIDKVSVMTLHGAKGLEFDNVFLPGWEEEVFPHVRALTEGGSEALEEERRLAYVGLTRARKRVLVTFAANRRVYNQWRASLPSRFLDELPEAHVERSAERGLYSGGGGGGARWGEESWVAGAYGSRRPPPVVEASSWKVAARSTSGDYAPGDRVHHQKFGPGTVVTVDGDKLEIAFDKAGTRKVLDSFVEPG
ncbi:UvrD-helicase domain-containing protein [Magnetospirillum sp. UT-4]|uniref:UvrD-helicase domain-containing protein n=1 Tax=Magnetospirillum sp. UT-4 TaxID=2681467 RepID=UPI00138266C8|nr:UvrD-helicase domain-containing protein [Magnetospirillum sp. UT-4]CAA7624224.1 UvrD [Magnetospirillum sp. UT-4]